MRSTKNGLRTTCQDDLKVQAREVASLFCALQPLLFIVECSTTQLYLAVCVARAVVAGALARRVHSSCCWRHTLSSVLFGEVSAIAAIEEELKKAQRKCTRVRITKAFRSVLIQEAAETLKDVTWLAQPRPVAGWDVLDWMKHLRNTVLWRRCSDKV